VDLKKIEKVVATIQTQLFRNSNSFSVGMLKSHFKGAGLQFKDHQVYAPGDDVRFIDWNVSARTNHTVVKTFEEERNIEIYPFLDFSETMMMGYKSVSKLQAAIEITCLLYLLADKSKDRVAPIIYLDKAYILPKASGQEGITIFISQLEKHGILNEDGKVNLAFDFNFERNEKKKHALLKSLIAKGKEVVFLTDFGNTTDFGSLNKLFYRRNLHCIKIESPLENKKKLPYLVFGQRKGKKDMVKQFTASSELNPQGRYKKINVKDRYLEKFVREML
jgi:hypothetical protein